MWLGNNMTSDAAVSHIICDLKSWCRCCHLRLSPSAKPILLNRQCQSQVGIAKNINYLKIISEKKSQIGSNHSGCWGKDGLHQCFVEMCLFVNMNFCGDFNILQDLSSTGFWKMWRSLYYTTTCLHDYTTTRPMILRGRTGPSSVHVSSFHPDWIVFPQN